MDTTEARDLLDEGTVIVDEPVPWAEAAHDPCPECGVCQDDHGEPRRIFHHTTCSIRGDGGSFNPGHRDGVMGSGSAQLSEAD